MAIRIINNCARKYRPDPEFTIKKILERIPSKFTQGLSKIEIYDKSNKKVSCGQYIKESKEDKKSKIEFYMNSNTMYGIPLFSILEQNLHFINAVNDHIEKNLKAKTSEPAILNYASNKLNLKWTYFGKWQPIAIFFRITTTIIHRVSIVGRSFAKVVFCFLNRRR